MTLLLYELPLRLPTISNFLFRLMMKYALGFNMQKNTEYCTYYVLVHTYVVCTKILLLYWCLPCHSKTQLCLACTLDTRPVFEGHNTYDFLATTVPLRLIKIMSLHMADLYINLLIWHSPIIYSNLTFNCKIKNYNIYSNRIF